jgi:enoyl-CoA hydratase/carnithine racemase
MTDLIHRGQALLQDLDGFSIEIDAGRERADIILHRPPFNVISMHARDQLRAAFEALDEDDRVRVIARRASTFRAAATSRAFSKLRPSMSRSSPGISPRPRAARSR